MNVAVNSDLRLSFPANHPPGIWTITVANPRLIANMKPTYPRSTEKAFTRKIGVKGVIIPVLTPCKASMQANSKIEKRKESSVVFMDVVEPPFEGVTVSPLSSRAGGRLRTIRRKYNRKGVFNPYISAITPPRMGPITEPSVAAIIIQL